MACNSIPVEEVVIDGIEFIVLNSNLKPCEIQTDNHCSLMYKPKEFGDMLVVKKDGINYSVSFQELTVVEWPGLYHLEGGLILGLENLDGRYVLFQNHGSEEVSEKFSVLRNYLKPFVNNKPIVNPIDYSKLGFKSLLEHLRTEIAKLNPAI